MVRCLKKAPKTTFYSSDEESDSEEEMVACKRRRITIKSGKVCTADSTILKQIIWSHELVYRPSDKLAVYDELSLTLLIQGYLVILEAEMPQQKEAMLKHLSKLMDG